MVVNNNGNISAAFTAQLQSFAPGLFMDLPSNFALVTRLPDYAIVADPSVVNGAVAAAPGDYVVAWGRGFGATDPPFQGGVVVGATPPLVRSRFRHRWAALRRSRP